MRIWGILLDKWGWMWFNGRSMKHKDAKMSGKWWWPEGGYPTG
jgi:hypothetical protein